MPSVVVVGQGSLVLGEVLVVVLVTVQRKPTASGVRVTSVGRHASRIFTAVLKVPSRRAWHTARRRRRQPRAGGRP
jgi:hypothetical protein